MDQELAPQPSEELIIELRDALAHLHDRSYLLRHPLMRLVQRESKGDSLAAVDRLRQLLCQAVEQLRPDPGTPPSSPAWRPYAVLHARYILGRETSEIERELALGIRQIQREQRRGLEMIALALEEKEAANQFSPAPSQQNVLAQELACLAGETGVANAKLELVRALEIARPLVLHYGVQVAYDQATSTQLAVEGNAELLRQLLVGTISFLVRHIPQGWLTVELMPEGEHILFRFVGRAGSSSKGDAAHSKLPTQLSTLADVLKARVNLMIASGNAHLSLRAPRLPEERTLVIIEDNTAMVALFSRYLQGHGYRLIGITDSANALDEVRRLRPHAIILDLMMQGVDGWELLRRLKGDPELREVPVVVCSVLAEPELARLLGAEAYLVKPVRPLQLRHCLSKLLGPDRSGAVGPR
jgi:CheY-like chemotaxis protein